MASFSARHRLHLLPPHLYDGAVETMDHFIDGSTPLSFARQTRQISKRDLAITSIHLHTVTKETQPSYQKKFGEQRIMALSRL